MDTANNNGIARLADGAAALAVRAVSNSERSDHAPAPADRLDMPPPHAAGGFTIVELVVTMGIMAILLGIFVVGYKNVGTGSQRKQTVTLLERLKNVSTALLLNKAASQKFFQQQIPYIYAEPIGSTITGTQYDAVHAAADDSLYRTALIVKAMLAAPEARAIFDDAPTERKKVYYFDTTNYNVVPSPPAPTPTVAGPFTLLLDAWGNPILYVFDNWQVATSATSSRVRANTVGPVGTGTAGGLTDLYSDAAKAYWELPAGSMSPAPKDAAYAAKYVSPTNPPKNYTIKAGDAFRSPDQQPFWVSAGPDGKYETHDDNLYSFGN